MRASIPHFFMCILLFFESIIFMKEVIMFKTKLFLRYVIFGFGLLITGFGIALSTKMGLGTTPISVIPLVVSDWFNLTFGMVANLLSLFFIGLEVLFGNFKRKAILGQLLVVPFFGWFIDLGFKAFANLDPSLGSKFIYLLIGCMLIAFGIHLQIKADVVVNPCDGLVLVFAQKFKMKFSTVKILVDVGIMLIGVLISLGAFGEVRGVGVATVFLALLTGYFIRLYKVIFDRLIPVWIKEK